MKDTAPGALRKLGNKHMVFDSITVKELESLAYEYYNEDMPTGERQPKSVSSLSFIIRTKLG
jgi:hypothetical protein